MIEGGGEGVGASKRAFYAKKGSPKKHGKFWEWKGLSERSYKNASLTTNLNISPAPSMHFPGLINWILPSEKKIFYMISPSILDLCHKCIVISNIQDVYNNFNFPFLPFRSFPFLQKPSPFLRRNSFCLLHYEIHLWFYHSKTKTNWKDFRRSGWSYKYMKIQELKGAAE